MPFRATDHRRSTDLSVPGSKAQVVCAPVMEPVEGRLLLSADVFTVNSTGGGTSGTGTSGTLPYVLSLANADPNPDGSEIEFDPVIFSSSSPQTISLGATLTLAETSGPEVIDGPGAGTVSISGGHALGVFDVKSGVTATISGLTITGGSATYRGGGVNNYGHVNLSDCTLSGNSAGGVGGGLSNDKGTATLTDCTLSGNSAANFGGAIVNDSGTITLNDCPIDDNDAGGNGAGLSNAGTATLTDCTISGNTSYSGGGVENFDILKLIGCTISSDSAVADNNVFSFGGGGLFNYGGASAKLTDCTISGNSAEHRRRRMDNFGSGTVTLTGCTINRQFRRIDLGRWAGQLQRRSATITGLHDQRQLCTEWRGGLQRHRLRRAHRLHTC